MNTAIVKYNKICMNSPGHTFPGSASTLQEDVVAMMASTKRKAPIKSPATGKKEVKPDDSKIKLPPFVKHFKYSTGSDGKKFKVGESKSWNNLTWYFCDCPNHRDTVKWHTHPATKCRTRMKWLEKEGEARANAGIEEENEEIDDVEEDVPPNDDGLANNLTLMLANALMLAQDNATATELISEALQAIREG
jgi:hypothetical protein